MGALTGGGRPRNIWFLIASRILGVVAILALLITPSEPDQPPPRIEGPNVLIIITDDQRPDTFDDMPAAKRFFANGIDFTNAIATTPVCCPSRASIFTGRYAHNHGVEKFTPHKLEQQTTLQAYLHLAGYSTGFFGKYLNGWELDNDPPYFDRWTIFPQSTRETYWGGLQNIDGDTRWVTMYSTDWLAQRALNFLRQAESEDDSRPWLMYLSTPAAHPPFRVEPEYRKVPVGRWASKDRSLFEKDTTDKPPHVRKPGETACDEKCAIRTRAKQLRTLMSVDTMVERVSGALDTLDESNTLAIYVSDNGTLWGEHGLGRKGQPYLPAVQVPLKLHWDGHTTKGFDHRITSTIDIAPTVLAAIGIEQNPSVPMDGNDLLAEEWRRSAILLEYWSFGGQPSFASVLSNRFQYTEYLADDDSVTFYEYYDLRKDPAELENVLADSAASLGQERLATLRARLRAYMSCSGSSCP